MAGDNGFLVPGSDVHVSGAAEGPLEGLRFMAKDLFDVAGHPTGAGNPDWARTHPIPSDHSWAVQTLLSAGASLTGKTITDEISLGLLGINGFHGTPLNPKAPDRVPGGSSSGSASAVAQGACDFALGTDTGGSVRVPASFCGLYGLRPTHGRVRLAGMLPQAPSSDTTGWFTGDASLMERVSAVMLSEAPRSQLPTKLVIAVDAFGFSDEAVQTALRAGVDRLTDLIGPAREDILAPQGISVWAQTQRTLQIAEAWSTFRDWVDAENPRFAYLVARTLQFGAAIPASALPPARLMRGEVRGRLAHLVPPGTILCLPTTPGVAPPRGQSIAEMDVERDRINCLACLGGLAGHPQLNLPLGMVDGAPVGLSIVGARGEDMTLVAVARALKEMA